MFYTTGVGVSKTHFGPMPKEPSAHCEQLPQPAMNFWEGVGRSQGPCGGLLMLQGD